MIVLRESGVLFRQVDQSTSDAALRNEWAPLDPKISRYDDGVICRI
jgi:hypothetical protein